MKSAQRHQLETNVLADWLGKKIESLEPYKNGIFVGALAVLALVVVGVFAFSGGDPQSAALWSNYYAAFGLQDPVPALENLAESPGNANSSAAMWAKKAVADYQLAGGCEQLFNNPKEAKEKLEKAEKLYQQVLDHGTDPMLKEAAHIGLARTLESLDRGDAARKEYEIVVHSGKETTLVKVAKEGLARLDDPRLVATLAWFAKQKPALPAGHPPLGTFPGMNTPVPDRPDFNFPTSPLGTGTNSTPTTDEPTTDKPESTDSTEEKPTEEKPVEEKSAETTTPDKPAEESATTEQPAEDKPADEQPADVAPTTEAPAAESPAPEPAPAEESK